MASRTQHRKRQAGQSVIIAIAVLFILAFLSALFISLLARNLERTGRSSQTLTADFYAQAGVRYADQMLTTSIQGADWRPPLKYAPSTIPTPLTTAQQNAYNGLATINKRDPDLFWLQQGFTRYPAQGGRFLLRVSYADPTSSATSKYIKIESIGRTGEIDDSNPADPTVFRAQPIRLHAEIVAYKPIGLLDYARFITNKDQRPDTFTLGVPSTFDNNTKMIVTPGVYDFPASSGAAGQYPLINVFGNSTGSSSSGNAIGQGGSLRCNGNLRLYGMNAAFLDGTLGDDWEIAGNLTFDGYQGQTSTSNPTELTVVGTDTTGNPIAAPAPANAPNGNATPSNTGSQFTSLGGLIRDAAETSDVNGFARSVKRLDPPSLDTVASGTDLNRYQAATDAGTAANQTTGEAAGPYQKQSLTSPATVFIDNLADAQTESTNVTGGAYTLRDDWLHPAAPNWQGPFYNPPGATIVFGPIHVTTGTTTNAFWGFTVTRSDQPIGLPSGSPVTWRWLGSDPAKPLTSPSISFAYGKAPNGFTYDPNNPVFFLDADNPTPTGGNNAAVNTNNDVVIYAQGNIRVRGVVSPTSATDPQSGATLTVADHHVTLVSGQVAYVEGSVLKGGSGYSAPNYQSNSSIAIMAERYVCVNTTQFLAGAILRSDLSHSATDPSNNTVDFTDNTLTESFDMPPVNYSFGANPGTATEGLYLSQFSDSSQNSEGLIRLNLYGTTPTTTYDGANNFALQGSNDTPNRTILDITTAFAPANLSHLDLTFGRSPTGTSTYGLERAAILPSDVRIEAILYAQNNSFFVIPGPWFNTDKSDTLDVFITKGARPQPQPNYANADSMKGVTDPQFPLYGQPIDMKITVNGAVSENVPANINDQAEWMQKWGWIPKNHGTPPPTGSTATPAVATASPHAPPQMNLPAAALTGIPSATQSNLPGVGLNFQYDRLAGAMPATSGGNPQTVRTDIYDRPLPFTPNMPVSPDLLYSGQTADNSLVQ